MKRFSSGFGCDPVKRTFTAPNEVWNEYLKSHPKHKSLRTESNADFEYLQLVVGKISSTGDGALGLQGSGTDFVLASKTNPREYDEGEEEEDEDLDDDANMTHASDFMSARASDYDLQDLHLPSAMKSEDVEDGRNTDRTTDSTTDRTTDRTTTSTRKRPRDYSATSKGKGVATEYQQSIVEICTTLSDLKTIIKESKEARDIERVEKSKEMMEKSRERAEKAKVREMESRDGWEELSEIDSIDPRTRYFIMELFSMDKVSMRLFLKMNGEERRDWINYKLSGISPTTTKITFRIGF